MQNTPCPTGGLFRSSGKDAVNQQTFEKCWLCAMPGLSLKDSMTQGRGLTLRCSQLDGKKDSQISRRYIALILSPGWFFFFKCRFLHSSPRFWFSNWEVGPERKYFFIHSLSFANCPQSWPMTWGRSLALPTFLSQFSNHGLKALPLEPGGGSWGAVCWEERRVGCTVPCWVWPWHFLAQR